MGSRTYTAKQLADLAGVSIRTLHYYEEAGLLAPARRGNNYREYRSADVERLQHILLLKACGLRLTDIKAALDGPHGTIRNVLASHLNELHDRRNALDGLIDNAIRTIDSLEGKTTMTDEQRFEGLKASMIERNEREYGAEARARYGDEAVDAANAKIANMDEGTFNDAQMLAEAINEQLKAAMANGDPEGHRVLRERSGSRSCAIPQRCDCCLVHRTSLRCVKRRKRRSNHEATHR